MSCEQILCKVCGYYREFNYDDRDEVVSESPCQCPRVRAKRVNHIELMKLLNKGGTFEKSNSSLNQISVKRPTNPKKLR